MKKTPEQISYNMSRIRGSKTKPENLLCAELWRRGLRSFKRNARTVVGQPDIVFFAQSLAVFCDGDFWHGYDWEHRRDDFKVHRDYWIPKIERNIVHDRAISYSLEALGWRVVRFWEHELKKELARCADTVEAIIRQVVAPPFGVAEINAGFGAMRWAIEDTAMLRPVVAVERGRRKALAYQRQFGQAPLPLISGEQLAQFLFRHPCQVVAACLRRGQGWPLNELLTLIELTRPCALCLVAEARHFWGRQGRTARRLLLKLAVELNYYLPSCPFDEDEASWLEASAVLFQAADFGSPREQSVLAVVAFDRERLGEERLSTLAPPPRIIVEASARDVPAYFIPATYLFPPMLGYIARSLAALGTKASC